MASTLCQKWFLKTRFLSKSSKLRVVWTIQFCSNFTSMWPKYLSDNVWRHLRHPRSASATVAEKSFNGKFTAKIGIFDWVFYITIADAVIGSLKSLHTLSNNFVKYLDHMLVKFEQNCMVRTVQNFELFDKKWLTIIDKVLTPFWKRFL